jgi:hypothetical protein
MRLSDILVVLIVAPEPCRRSYREVVKVSRIPAQLPRGSSRR